MLALFFGDTEFPKQILKKIKKKKIKHIIIDLSKNRIYEKNPNSYSIGIGQFGKIFKLLKEKKCNRALFAGKINKPKLSTLKLDLIGVYYLPRIIKAAKLGDAAILKTIIKIFIKKKIKIVRSNFYNPELTLSKGLYSKIKPNKADFAFINKGINLLNNINPYNHVQGLVVSNSKIVAKETVLGTKKMLKKLKNSKTSENFRGILIKYPKKKQDLRIDLPTIGLDTLKDCNRTKIKGIVLKSKYHIFMNKNECINFANKNKIFIIVK